MVKVTEKIANITTTKRETDGLKWTFSLKFGCKLTSSVQIECDFYCSSQIQTVTILNKSIALSSGSQTF